jgi:hypothetical protein
MMIDNLADEKIGTENMVGIPVFFTAKNNPMSCDVMLITLILHTTVAIH